MKILMPIRQLPLPAVIVAGLALVLFGTIVLLHGTQTDALDSFANCAEAGYPVTDSNPPVCRNGKYYITGPRATKVPDASVVQSLPFDLLVTAETGTDTPRQQIVIRTQAEWSSWWSKVHAGLVIPPLIPVDFATNSVVMIIGGPKETTGYNYKVTAVSLGKRSYIVDTVESVPTLSCVVEPKRTNRYYIVRTSKLTQSVVFRNTENLRHCK